MKRYFAPFTVGFVVAIFLMYLIPLFRDYILGFDRNLDAGYNQISLDMPLAEVRHLMHSDGTRSNDFRLEQYAGYEIEYAAANRSGAKYFLSWRNGVDWRYTVGFTDTDKVIYKAKGDS